MVWWGDDGCGHEDRRSDTKYRLLQIQTAELDKLKLRLEEANTSYRLTRQEAMRLREARTGHTVRDLP